MVATIIDTILAQREDKKKVKKPLKWLYPMNVERFYIGVLVDFFIAYSVEINKLLATKISGLFNQANIYRKDDWTDDVESLDEEMTLIYASLVISEGLIKKVGTTAIRTSLFNKVQLKKVIVSAIGVDPTVLTQELYLNQQIKVFVKKNVSLITGLSDWERNRITTSLYRDLASGESVTNIKNDVKKTLRITENRAKLIARDQVSKLNANLTELRQRELGIKKYRWLTSRDERVRPTHRANEGKIFEWDNPPMITGHPSRDIICRCSAQPVFKNS